MRRSRKPKTTGTGRMRIATWLPPSLVRQLEAQSIRMGLSRTDLIERGARLVLSQAGPCPACNEAKSA